MHENADEEADQPAADATWNGQVRHLQISCNPTRIANTAPAISQSLPARANT